jgi:hypothetical protein
VYGPGIVGCVPWRRSTGGATRRAAGGRYLAQRANSSRVGEWTRWACTRSGVRPGWDRDTLPAFRAQGCAALGVARRADRRLLRGDVGARGDGGEAGANASRVNSRPSGRLQRAQRGSLGGNPRCGGRRAARGGTLKPVLRVVPGYCRRSAAAGRERRGEQARPQPGVRRGYPLGRAQRRELYLYQRRELGMDRRSIVAALGSVLNRMRGAGR